MKHFVQDIICVFPGYVRHANRLTPDEFLAWAKTDLKGSDRRAIGNALGNIKKAVHCRLDEIIAVTHVQYCSDWNPRCSTETKLHVLKDLGLPYQTIVQLITDIRNTFEHQYLLPHLQQVRAYYDITELWLEDSRRKCDIGMIGLADIPLQGYSIHAKKRGNVFGSLTFGTVQPVIFFWNSKKVVVHLDAKGQRKTDAMTAMPWRTMVKLEEPYVRRALRSTSKTTVNQASTTYAFQTYERWITAGGQQNKSSIRARVRR